MGPITAASLFHPEFRLWPSQKARPDPVPWKKKLFQIKMNMSGLKRLLRRRCVGSDMKIYFNPIIQNLSVHDKKYAKKQYNAFEQITEKTRFLDLRRKELQDKKK